MYRETAKKAYMVSKVVSETCHAGVCIFRKFSKSPGYIRKIPLNPPLQKGEAVGMAGLIEMLLYFVCNGSVNGKDKTYVQFK